MRSWALLASSSNGLGWRSCSLHVAYPHYPRADVTPYNPFESGIAFARSAAWGFIAVRLGAKTTLLVPVMEELFWRDFVWRAFMIAPVDFKLAGVGEADLTAILTRIVGLSAPCMWRWITAAAWFGVMIAGLLVDHAQPRRMHYHARRDKYFSPWALCAQDRGMVFLVGVQGFRMSPRRLYRMDNAATRLPQAAGGLSGDAALRHGTGRPAGAAAAYHEATETVKRGDRRMPPAVEQAPQRRACPGAFHLHPQLLRCAQHGHQGADRWARRDSRHLHAHRPQLHPPPVARDGRSRADFADARVEVDP